MKALIIDDHNIQRLYLKNLVQVNFPDIKVIDEADSVASALECLNLIDYDIIFLDMELGDGMGFDIMKVIKEFVYVIVVSAHKEYAIEAFKHNVVDYILKPVNLIEFKNAVKKVIQKFEGTEEKKSTAQQFERKGSFMEADGALMVNHNNAYVTIHLKDILYIKAQGKNSQIYMCDNKHYTSYKNLKEFESAMSTYLLRIHHSYLVNVKNIVSYSRDTSHLLLNGGAEVPVSVRKREELFKKFRVF